MLQSMKKNGTILGIFAIATTALVATTNWLTQDTILEQQQKDLQRTLGQVIPSDSHDNLLFNSCISLKVPTADPAPSLPAYIATLNGKPTGIAIEAIAPDGYNGAIKLIIGLDMQGNVLSSRVLNHNETPGLGDKIEIRKSSWIQSFDRKTVNDSNQESWAVRKDGGQFDQFTGATITPRAVVKAVKTTILYFKANKGAILNTSSTCES